MRPVLVRDERIGGWARLQTNVALHTVSDNVLGLDVPVDCCLVLRLIITDCTAEPSVAQADHPTADGTRQVYDTNFHHTRTH